MNRLFQITLFCIIASLAAMGYETDIISGQGINSSENNVVQLNFNDGHYYFDGIVEGVSVKDILLESAIPGLLIGEEMFEKIFNHFGLESLEKQEGKKIALHKNIYEIEYIHPVTISINEGVFSGKIFVLKGYDQLALPIQNFAYKDTTKPYLKIDIHNKSMQFLSGEKWNDKTDYEQFELKCIKGFPIIVSKLMIDSYEKTGVIPDSRYIIDFGNGSLLFLMKGNQDVDMMLKHSELKIVEGKNREGKVVSEAIMADTCVLCGRKYYNQPIGLTDKMKTFQGFSGLIGLKFFNMPVVFDFENGKFYVHKQNPKN